uniref:Uncharacterized protein n=1 Tax=Arundo donax TaxID=35708 RepID=A0A0A9B954_ARUDO
MTYSFRYINCANQGTCFEHYLLLYDFRPYLS